MSIDWNNMNCPLNSSYTVGDLLKNDPSRIPVHQDVKDNLVILADCLKILKMRSKIPFMITLGYLPSKIARVSGYTNDCLKPNGIPSFMYRFLSFLDFYLHTSFYEKSKETWGEWTRNYPITQGKWVAIVPVDLDGLMVQEPNIVAELLAECEKWWNGKIILSENEKWIGLSI